MVPALLMDLIDQMDPFGQNDRRTERPFPVSSGAVWPVKPKAPLFFFSFLFFFFVPFPFTVGPFQN